MNVVLPLCFRGFEYQIEYNEPDSTANTKEYTVRIESIKTHGDKNVEMENQIGKEFLFRISDLGNIPLFPGTDEQAVLGLIINTYREHITKDVNVLKRV